MSRLWSTLQRAVAQRGDRLALTDGAVRRSYVEVAARAAALAGGLRRAGVGVGDRVAILASNSAGFLEAYYAAAGTGAILVPLNHRLAAAELRAILDDCGAALVLAEERFAPLAAAAGAAAVGIDALAGASPPGGAFEPAALPGDAVAQLYYTSGTTGRPKGVMLTHDNVYLHALGAIAELGLDDRDRWGHIAPMFHLADAWATFAVTLAGGQHVMVSSFAPDAVLDAIEGSRITISNLVPTMLNQLVNHPQARARDLSSLRMVLSGGAPISPELVRRVIEICGCEYVQTYGMTETSPYLTLSLLKAHLRRLPADERLTYVAKTGRPFITVELQVVDARGAPVASDGQQVGEILVRGPTVTPGYWRRPEETARAFTEQGWLRTGDLAVVDTEGYVDIVDRKKDMIISGGENIYSIEVENALYAHPAVLEVAVFGEPDETWGEAVCAAVVLRPGAEVSAEALIACCREQLAGFKAPRRIRFCDALPKTGSGKIAKRLLRQPADPP